MNKPTVRLNPELHKRAKKLVGYHGNKSVEQVVNKALEEHCKKMEKK